MTHNAALEKRELLLGEGNHLHLPYVSSFRRFLILHIFFIPKHVSMHETWVPPLKQPS